LKLSCCLKTSDLKRIKKKEKEKIKIKNRNIDRIEASTKRHNKENKIYCVPIF